MSTIFHVDVNSAFLSWEAAYRIHHLQGRLDIRTIPSAVGGSPAQRHGIILAKSIPAKKYGIQTGMSVIEARQLCPDLYLVPPNYNLYQRCSEAFMHILRSYTPDTEVYSIDEAYMNMSQVMHLYNNDPVTTANTIRQHIKDELGFTVNIGVSSNKLLAKMAGDFKKPDYVHTLFPEEVKEKIWPLKVEDLFFVGRATKRKLNAIGIQTIGQLAGTDLQLLKAILKKHGEVIWNFANGLDFSSVEPVAPVQKGYGNSTTMSQDVTDAKGAYLVLLALCETVAARLRKNKVKAELISVGIKHADFTYTSHQMIMKAATNITNEIYGYACQLFNQLWDEASAIRHLGIHTSRLTDNLCMRQLNLFDVSDYVRLEKLDATIDTIRLRYGLDSVKRAAFLRSRVDHMEGGVSREKRTVNYEQLKID